MYLCCHKFINRKKLFVMKKITVLLVSAIFVIAFTSCSGAKKNDASANEPVKTEAAETVNAPEPQPEAPALSPAEMLKSFQEYAKAYGDAFNNISKDLKKYSELAGQSKNRIEEMEKIKTKLNKKQAEDYQKALELVLKVNRGGK